MKELFRAARVELLLTRIRGRLRLLLQGSIAFLAMLPFGIFASLDFMDTTYVYLSLPGLWFLISALMLDNIVKAKENGFIEILLQVQGNYYIKAIYWLYFLTTYFLSLIQSLLLTLFISSIIGSFRVSVPPLIALPAVGSAIFITGTTIIFVRVEGMKLLDTFSKATGGLTILSIAVIHYLREVHLAQAAALLLVTFALILLTTNYLSSRDFPAMLTA